MPTGDPCVILGGEPTLAKHPGDSPHTFETAICFGVRSLGGLRWIVFAAAPEGADAASVWGHDER